MLRHAARVGDFREAALGSGPLAAAARGWDGLRSEEEVHAALKLACWINSVEMAKFSGGRGRGGQLGQGPYLLADHGRLASA